MLKLLPLTSGQVEVTEEKTNYVKSILQEFYSCSDRQGYVFVQ